MRRAAPGLRVLPWACFAWVLAAAAVAAPATTTRAATADAQQLCRVSVSLDPPRAVVGQQVLYRLRIDRRKEVVGLRWERNLSFPAFRAEWLPGSLLREPPEEGDFHRFEERRALFPVRAGVLEIPEAGLLCRTAEGEEVVTVPAVSLVVEEPPEEGRPEGFAGLAGAVEVVVTLSRDEIALGESVRLSVYVHGPANLWDLEPPLPVAELAPHIEVLSEPPSLARDAGRRLHLRRYFTYDLVPRRPGHYELPPLRLAYFDPAVGRYAVSEARSGSFVVRAPSPESGPDAAAAAPPLPPPDVDPVVGDPAGGAGLWLAALGLAVGAAALLAFALTRRVRGSGHGAATAALAEASAAERAGEVAAAAAALARGARAALAEDLPDARALSTEELRARAEGERARSLVSLLERLDRVRFARQGSLAEIAALRAAFEDALERPPR